VAGKLSGTQSLLVSESVGVLVFSVVQQVQQVSSGVALK
jgi:hypothetical protein